MRNGMGGPVVAAALTNAEPSLLPPVVPSGREAPSLHLLPHLLPHTEFTVNNSMACAISASSDLFISVISKPRALTAVMEQLLWLAAKIFVQVTSGTDDTPSSHGALASSHFEPRHSTYAAIVVGLVAFAGTAQTICVLVIVVVVVVMVVVVVTAHDVALLWTGMAAIFVPELQAVHVISETLPDAW